MAAFKRELRVVVRAQDAYSKELKKAGAAFDKLGSKVESTSRKSNRGLLSMQNLMLSYIAISAGKTLITSIAGLEEGWVGVAKTTGMAGDELEDLKQTIGDLSVEMRGVSIEEFQSITQTAGQLGIRGVKNLREFTRVVAMMTVATNLTAEEASRSFAQIANAMGIPIDQLETMGSVMNELSNTSVATASDISNLTLRMAGAARNIGITSAETMALSATLRDMGVDLQVGGTAFSQIFQKMLTNTQSFARAAGVPLAKFEQMILDHPIRAVKLLIENMAQMDKLEAARTLKDLQLEGVRVGGVLLKVKDGVFNLTKHLITANKEQEKGTSLAIEYATASQTFNAQLDSTLNAVKLLAQEFGIILLPFLKTGLTLIGGMAEGLTDFSQAIRDYLAIQDEFEGGGNALIAVQNELGISTQMLIAIKVREYGIINQNTEVVAQYAASLLEQAGAIDKVAEAQRFTLEQTAKMKDANADLLVLQEKLKLSFYETGENSTAAVRSQIAALEAYIESLEQAAGSQGVQLLVHQQNAHILALRRYEATLVSLSPEQEKLQQQIDKLATSNERLGVSTEMLIALKVRDFAMGGAHITQVGVYAAALLEQARIEKELADQKLIATQSTFDQHLLAFEWHQQKLKMAEELTDKEKKEAEKRLKAEAAVHAKVKSMKFAAANQAIALLNVLGSENKVAAIAAIALQKGLAIAQAKINITVGATAAMKIGPEGAPAAAAIKAWGAVQIALIAATGIAQAASLGGGGPSVGGVSSDGDGDGSSTLSPIDSEPAQQMQQIVVNIVNPVGTDEDLWRKITEDNIIPAMEAVSHNANITINTTTV